MTAPYGLQYAAAWVVGIIGIASLAIASAWLTPFHPTWLTADVASTAGIISGICVPLEALLPQLHRTPAVREANYVGASMGVLPPDLAAKFPHVATPPMVPPQP